MSATEQDLAAIVVGWLTERGWDVYQEVAIMGKVADIVAVRGPCIWIVECKVRLGFEVIDQAWGWQGYAHFVSVATPPRKERFAHVVLSRFEIGHLEVTGEKWGVDGKIHRALSHMHRPDKKWLERTKASLCEEQKSHAQAGSAAGGHYTPFKGTCNALKKYVGEHPGCTMKEAIDEIDHHYASDKSARANLADMIFKGVVKGIRLEKDGRANRLYPVPDPA